MTPEDSARLVRIETILTESIAPRLNGHSEKLEKHDIRLKAVERVAMVGGIVWGGMCVIAYLAKDAAAEWLARKVAH